MPKPLLPTHIYGNPSRKVKKGYIAVIRWTILSVIAVCALYSLYISLSSSKRTNVSATSDESEPAGIHFRDETVLKDAGHIATRHAGSKSGRGGHNPGGISHHVDDVTTPLSDHEDDDELDSAISPKQLIVQFGHADIPHNNKAYKNIPDSKKAGEVLPSSDTASHDQSSHHPNLPSDAALHLKAPLNESLQPVIVNTSHKLPVIGSEQTSPVIVNTSHKVPVIGSEQTSPVKAPDVYQTSSGGGANGNHLDVQGAVTTQQAHSKGLVTSESRSQEIHGIMDEGAETSLFSLTAVDIDGQEVHLSKYAGKVVVVVNVASACGYTNENYKGLQATYKKYKDHGLEILGFPCNQFGQQEPGSEAEIKDFCSTMYHVTFPMFSKVEVNGDGMHPVYKFLRQKLPVSEGGGGGLGYGRDLVWNFFKFVVNKKGQPVKLFHQNYDSSALEHEVYRLLHEDAAV
ncbi:hypothetical protein CEUSTIGMA_g5716.t1 [Chlamydomonas eustigma]|uniref:Glutathione peroxidase n=1 Tax=Chlamydomonas eustigma TaxID=1157962 RepID=A0A250X5B1_9CHLO|nr:hypothetical protein CEUSTIGMA_g5716.t1 [Chlamydomonas eustigma]|eukprot:GAX78274.1 hypothetical protein CEUSTIGMA_g5716.t1 [Chlamydomonas eustigma]